MISPELLEQLKKHEGFRSKPYICTAGKLTIGYGRNLDDAGIDQSEADTLLRNDIYAAIRELDKYPWAAELDQVRFDAMVNFMVNVGAHTFSKFEKMIAAMEAKSYDRASMELMDSLYAKQVGKRAVDLSYMIEVGEYPPEGL